MTQKEFIEVLDGKGYSYEIEGDRIVVTYKGNVYFDALTSISPGVVFENRGGVNLYSLTSISPDVEFNNGGRVYLRSLIGGYTLVDGWFNKWNGNIEGIDSNRLLNKMINKGVFEI
jgi:hypothetical protein